jgi:hypothetical protein
MYQADDHPLAEFVYRTFGSRFADLLMVGYNEELSRKRKIFRITEEIAGRGFEWMIEAIGNSLPSRQEPLVLAALIKILLTRSTVSQQLVFGMDELIDTIGRRDELLMPGAIDNIITNYASLSFHKEPSNKMAERIGLKWGQYSLIKAYLRGSVRNPGESIPQRTSRLVEIDAGFVEGIKMGKVYFADINFSQIQLGNDPIL